MTLRVLRPAQISYLGPSPSLNCRSVRPLFFVSLDAGQFAFITPICITVFRQGNCDHRLIILRTGTNRMDTRSVALRPRIGVKTFRFRPCSCRDKPPATFPDDKPPKQGLCATTSAPLVHDIISLQISCFKYQTQGFPK